MIEGSTNEALIKNEDTKNTYSSRFVSVMMCAASAIAFGNLWRFPYLVYAHGGLLFIIIYIIVLIFFAYPLVAFELGTGQQLQGAQSKVFSHVSNHGRAPALITWTSFTILLYYPLLLAWSLIFFFNSFTTTFSWANPPEWISICESFATEEACLTQNYCSWRNDLCAVDSLHNSKIFLREKANVYDDFEGEDRNLKIGSFSPAIALGLAGTWILVFLCVFGGARILGYTTYVTMGLPLVLLLIIVVLTATFDGAKQGVIEYIGKFNFNQFSAKSVLDAVSQSVFSLSLGQGALVAISSHSNKHENFVENGLYLTIADTGASLVSGFAVFSVLGFLSKQSNIPISELPISGIALAFVTYPAALTQMAGFVATIAAILFFFVLWLLGFSTVCTLIESLVLSIEESKFGKRYNLTRFWVTLAFCAFYIILPGMLISTNIGFALLDTMDAMNAVTHAFSSGSQAMAFGWIHLSSYSIKRTGKVAYYVHAATFFFGAAVFGIFDRFTSLGQMRIVYGLLVGLVIAFAGFFLSIFFYQPEDQTEGTISNFTFRQKAYYLGIYNVEGVRTFLNNCIRGSGKLKLPMFWSFSLKYVISFVTFYLFVSGATDFKSLFLRPSPEAHYPIFISIMSLISPLLMLCAMIFVTYMPDKYAWLMPPDLDYMELIGEQELLATDNEKVSTKC